jgi:lipid A 4'-phosphatase
MTFNPAAHGPLLTTVISPRTATQLTLAWLVYPWTAQWPRGPLAKLIGGCVARTTLVLILVAIAAVGVAFAICPDWDLAVTHLFFDPTTKQFPLSFNPAINWLRNKAVFITIACLVCLGASVVLKIIRPWRQMWIPGRAVIFLALTFLLGPGMLVNWMLKEHWSRPRPAEVVEFGGDKPFVPWWDPRGACEQNCSFVSGETSTATWTLAAAVLIPGTMGMVAIGTAMIYTVAMAVMRLIVGGHFFTDVAFAILFTSLLIWIAHGLIYRWPQTALDEKAIEHAIARAGYFAHKQMIGSIRRCFATIARILQHHHSNRH